MRGAGVTTRLAGYDDLDAVAELFDLYRQFYKQASDVDAARKFLKQRMEVAKSALICAERRCVIAERHCVIAGFTQLYPSFSSVSMKPIWILNDLYVAQAHRRAGIGEALLDAAKAHAHQTGATYLMLSTEHDNTHAQSLYEANGWQLDSKFRTYICQL